MMDSWEKIVESFKDGQEDFRDQVIAYIIGFQNERYWQIGEGYRALQELLELIIERHGDMGQDFKG